jgi:hypothetical protein
MLGIIPLGQRRISVQRVHVESVRVAFNDGNHNAFTDLARFRDRFYLTFRTCPDGHMLHATSRIIVMASDDAVTWEPVFEFGVPERDVRDPHFLVFQGKLFVYSGTWLCAGGGAERRDINEQLGFGAWSGDGVNWNGPRYLEGTYGHYIWRAKAHGGVAYLCGRRKRGFAPTIDLAEQRALLESAMLASDDGLVWRPVGLFQEEFGNETAFLFEADGGVIALGRGDEVRPAQICCSRPPYDAWSRTDLDRNVGGPMLERWGDRILVGGRKWLAPKEAVTALYWLVDDQLQEIAVLPSGGDNSYPGFIELDDGRGLLSYYSSHEGSGTSLAPAAIYIAELSME